MYQYANIVAGVLPFNGIYDCIVCLFHREVEYCGTKRGSVQISKIKYRSIWADQSSELHLLFPVKEVYALLGVICKEKEVSKTEHMLQYIAMDDYLYELFAKNMKEIRKEVKNVF